MKLECSSKGDKRFSAFNAKVSVNDNWDSIENHYQLSKRFGNSPPPNHWRECKGKKPTHFVINNIEYDIKYFSCFYKLLWVKYLDDNPDLVEYAKQYDEFTDMFRGKSLNCQADVISQYVKEGRQSILDECEEFIKLLRG